jgi:hypothetical protein
MRASPTASDSHAGKTISKGLPGRLGNSGGARHLVYQVWCSCVAGGAHGLRCSSCILCIVCPDHLNSVSHRSITLVPVLTRASSWTPQDRGPRHHCNENKLWGNRRPWGELQATPARHYASRSRTSRRICGLHIQKWFCEVCSKFKVRSEHLPRWVSRWVGRGRGGG